MGLFDTPDNERSFSALVDKVIVETGRPGALSSIATYVNLTIKECQALGLFARDMREVEITATANPHIYVKPRYHRSIRAVRYATSGVYPKVKLPGRAQERLTTFFYSVDDSYVFKGVMVGETIQAANYMWANPLRYFGRLGVSTLAMPGGPYDVRPAYFDLDDGTWKYLNLLETSYVDTLGDDDEEELRRNITENWLTSDWWELILEGTKAKVHKQFGDERAVLHFANYKQSQTLLRNTSNFEAEVGALVGSE